MHAGLFLLSYGLGFLLAFFKNPAYLFGTYIIVFFFNPADRWWGGAVPSVSYSLIVVLFMIIFVAFKIGSTNIENPFKSPILKKIYFFIALYILTYFIAIYPELHVKILKEYITLAVIISIAYAFCRTEKELDIYFYSYFFGAWYISLLTYQIGRNSGERVEGIGTPESGDANFTAASLAPSLIMIFYFFWMKSDIKIRILLALAGIFILNALILINSRGAFLGVLVGGAYFLMYMFFSKLKVDGQKLLVIAFLLVGIAGLLAVADKSFIDRMVGIGDVELKEEETSGATRVYYWIAAWEMTKDMPFGSGVQGFYYYSPYYISEDVKVSSNNDEVLNRSVHSSWFEILSEVGYLGWVLYFIILFTVFRLLKRCRDHFFQCEDRTRYFKVIAIESAIITFLVAMTFINRSRGEVLHWLFLFAACAYNIYILKPAKKKGGLSHKPL